MKNSVQIGRNKTGLLPLKDSPLFDGEDDKFKPFAQAEEDPRPEQTYKDIKKLYIEDTGAVGTVPRPATLKGAAVTGLQKLTARNPEVFVDKLGERLAFERGGVRLYEALIVKCQTQLSSNEIEFLEEIRADEARHFQVLHDAMQSIGADPTAITPCANVTAVMAKGLIDVINDLRTSIAQSVGAALVAELADNDGWDLLMELTANAGLNDLNEQFRRAKEDEDRHLGQIRTWLKELVQANEVEPLH